MTRVPLIVQTRLRGVRTPSAPAVASLLERVSGDGQTTTPGNVFPAAMVVRVRDQYGAPVAGTVVTGTVTAGGGAFLFPTVTTNAEGLAQFIAIAGASAGSNTFTLAVTGLAGSPVVFSGTGGTTTGQPSFALLPELDYQVPDYSAFRAAGMHTGPVGTTFTDPSSGRLMRKLTDVTTYPGGGVTFVYGDNGPQISAQHSGGVHTLVAWEPFGGAESLLDYNPTTGVVGNKRARPSGMATNMRSGFSRNPATPSILYFLTSTSRIIRWNVATNAEAPAGIFPSGGLVIAPSFGTSNEGWFRTAWNGSDEFFCWHDGAADRVYWLHGGTGQLRTRVFASYNEPHLDKTGRYIFKQGSPFDIWDTTTDTIVTAPGTTNDVHPCTVNGLLIGQNPSGGLFPVEILAPNGTRTTHSIAGETRHIVGAHLFANHNQATSDGTQWFGSKQENAQNELLCYKPSSWTNDGGQVYYATISLWGGYQETSRRPCNFVVQTNPADQYEVLHTLTRVASRAAMVERSSFFDTATNRLYVWVPSGGSPGATIIAWSTFPNGQGSAFSRLDGTASVKAASAYNLLWQNLEDYWERNWTQISVDGRLVVWGSNMGKSMRSTNSPRLDLFAVTIPESA